MTEDQKLVAAKPGMKTYKANHSVQAFRIKRVVRSQALQAFLVNESGDLSAEVDYNFINGFQPTPGGYYVEYEDGSQSFMLKTEFEARYK